MKILITTALALITSAGYSQTDCKPYVPTSKGAKWEITNYTSKGKEAGKAAYELIEKVETSNSSTFTVKVVSYDKKGQETFTSQYNAFCENGEFKFDMALKMDGQVMEAYKDMDIDVDASDLKIPTMDATPGTSLADGTLVMKIGTSSAALLTMTILITDRKIEAKEDLTTPAGTFETIKLSQKISTKMLIKVVGTSKEWYAEGIGMVRSESYNKGGKLMGYSELTKFEKM